MKPSGNTREKLLTVAFEEFYTYGYSATGLNTLLEKAGLHKGSLYHLFSSKKELALAVINERISARFRERYAHLIYEEKPLQALFDFTSNPLNFDLKRGCPLGKLVQELSSLDPDFQEALANAYLGHEQHIQQILNQAVLSGELPPCNTGQVATFFVSAMSGIIQRTKLSNNESLFVECMALLKVYITKP
jgi:TetR/AcrR family transcriptional repressor of nem operon